MKTKEKPVSFTQLFRQKRLVEKLSHEYNKQSYELEKMLKKSEHLSQKIATYNKKKYYITIKARSPWNSPQLEMQPVEK
jgi:phage shock protein A